LGCKTYQNVLHPDVPFICWFRVVTVLLCVFGVFTAEEFDGVGDTGLDSATVDVQTFLEAFLNMSLRSACPIDETFL
jgi:hypothetical protein